MLSHTKSRERQTAIEPRRRFSDLLKEVCRILEEWCGREEVVWVGGVGGERVRGVWVGV